jgi:hypothetical protein
MMNEQIRELAKEAGANISTRNLMSNPPQHVETVELWDDRIEKFAELIVRECARIAVVNQAENMGWDIGEILLEHFGVESEIERCPRCNEEWSGTSCGISDCGWITGVE